MQNCKEASASVHANPQDAHAWLNLGHSLAARQHAAQARCCYQQALNLADSLGDLRQALTALASDELNWGALSRTITVALETVRRLPHDPRSWTILGDLLTEANAPVKAMQCYQRVLEIDPIFTTADPATARVLAIEGTYLPAWLQETETERPTLLHMRPQPRSKPLTLHPDWPMSAA